MIEIKAGGLHTGFFYPIHPETNFVMLGEWEFTEADHFEKQQMLLYVTHVTEFSSFPD
ncbi:MAG TPA: hypothetical protein PKC54_02230 [Ferruginibacter sp.]|nr:hypothetical protein [Ferruginibacter sp.]